MSSDPVALASVEITLHPRAMELIEELHASGLFGITLEDTLEELVLLSLRSELDRGVILSRRSPARGER